MIYSMTNKMILLFLPITCNPKFEQQSEKKQKKILYNLIYKLIQVWFSNRRAKWRRHNRNSLFRPYDLIGHHQHISRPSPPTSPPPPAQTTSTTMPLNMAMEMSMAAAAAAMAAMAGSRMNNARCVISLPSPFWQNANSFFDCFLVPFPTLGQ